MELANLKAIARSCMESGRVPDAIAIFEQILERAPGDGYATDALGFLYYQQEDFERARDCCLRSLAAEPDNAYAHKGLGLCLIRLGQGPEGIASLERSVGLAPDYLDARHDLVVSLLELGRHPAAAAALAAAEATLERQSGLPAELGEQVRGQFHRLRQQLGRDAAANPVGAGAATAAAQPPQPTDQSDASIGRPDQHDLPDIAPTAGVPAEADPKAKEIP